MSNSTNWIVERISGVHLAPYWVNEIELGLYPLITGVVGWLVALFFTYRVMSAPEGTEEMKRVQQAIQTGAVAFLKAEYAMMLIFLMVINALVMAAISPYTGICYLVGAAASAFCGYIGLAISVRANVRTTQAASNRLNDGLRIAFASGSVMGLAVVSTALICLSALFMIYRTEWAYSSFGHIPGFGMGATSVSLFNRVGGGIYTKAADVGADLVGKVENSLEEDDVRNPATIADNVGDNVGDVCGMGADIFGSFAGSMIATCLLGYSQNLNQTIFPGRGPCTPDRLELCGMLQYLALPYWISATGIIASIIGIFFVQTKEETVKAVESAIRRGLFVAMFFQLGFIAVIVHVLGLSWKLYGCIIIGLVCGRTIGANSEYFTSYSWGPTRSIAESGRAGHASVIIQGLSVGMMSTFYPAFAISGTVLASVSLAGTYGLALTSTGLLSNLAITLATDAFGPVADNAGGIAEMCKGSVNDQTRNRTDILDAIGNTTAAIGKGFAMASAVLTGLALLSSYVSRVPITGITLVILPQFQARAQLEGFEVGGYTLAGLLVGAMIPFLFSAVTMGAVAKAARAVVFEVRRQLKERPGIINGEQTPDYARCVRIVTVFSIYSLVIPAIVVIIPPITLGIGLGPHFLGGIMAAGIVGAFILGSTMSASGGSWDNAKKFVEKGGVKGENGVALGKGSEVHKATVTGDTVGDPFKDTSGPSLNIYVKLATYMGVVLSKIYKNQHKFWWVSLIIIGVLLVFVPLWQMYINKQFNALEAEARAATVKDKQAQVELAQRRDAEPQPVLET